MKNEQAINAGRKQGVAVGTLLKWRGGSNKNKKATKNTTEVDPETKVLELHNIFLNVARLTVKE